MREPFKPSKSFFQLFFLLIVITAAGCSDKVVSPPPEKVFGVQGTVLDTAGNPVSGAKFYCLFDYGYIPDSTGGPSFPDSPLRDSVFSNELFQNFPNPLSKDTYLRFSLHQKSAVDLRLISKLDGSVVYELQDTLEYGLYQRYLAIGSSPRVKNGIYRYVLGITPIGGTPIQFEKEMLILNYSNAPNFVSTGSGFYMFNYNDAFVGDTVSDCYSFEPGVFINILLLPSFICGFLRKGI